MLDSRPTDQGRTERVTDQPATGQADTAGEEPGAPLDLDAATERALLSLSGRSPDIGVCPFLRAEADGPPSPDAAEHRCVAQAPFVALGDRQRQLTCQRAAHRSCPQHRHCHQRRDQCRGPAEPLCFHGH